MSCDAKDTQEHLRHPTEVSQVSKVSVGVGGGVSCKVSFIDLCAYVVFPNYITSFMVFYKAINAANALK